MPYIDQGKRAYLSDEYYVVIYSAVTNLLTK